MGQTAKIKPRPMTDEERRLIAFLGGHVRDPESALLRQQVETAQVVEEYIGAEDPSIVVSTDPAFRLNEHGRRIIEAQGPEADAATIHVLLHLTDGRIWELEVFRMDGGPIPRLPSPEELTIAR